MDIEQLHLDYRRDGFVHFHHPHTWHGSPVNVSDRPRRAIAIHLMTEGAMAGNRIDPRIGLMPGEPMVKARSPQLPLLYPRDAMYNGETLQHDPLRP